LLLQTKPKYSRLAPVQAAGGQQQQAPPTEQQWLSPLQQRRLSSHIVRDLCDELHLSAASATSAAAGADGCALELTRVPGDDSAIYVQIVHRFRAHRSSGNISSMQGYPEAVHAAATAAQAEGQQEPSSLRVEELHWQEGQEEEESAAGVPAAPTAGCRVDLPNSPPPGNGRNSSWWHKSPSKEALPAASAALAATPPGAARAAAAAGPPAESSAAGSGSPLVAAYSDPERCQGSPAEERPGQATAPAAAAAASAAAAAEAIAPASAAAPAAAGEAQLAQQQRGAWLFEINPEHVLIGERLAVGGFAEVFVGRYQVGVDGVKGVWVWGCGCWWELWAHVGLWVRSSSMRGLQSGWAGRQAGGSLL
jgi:hypothetical protein